MIEKTTDIDFDKIVLSEEERATLDRLNFWTLLMGRLNWNNRLVRNDEQVNQEALSRLIHFNLAAKVTQEDGNCYAYVTDTGWDYLAYTSEKKKQKEEQKRVESRRYWITTGIALAALIKSFLPEIRAGLEWLLKLLTQR